MNEFFNYDNKIFNALIRMTDAFVLGVLWLICCIPVFTIGASSSAFYYAYNKSVRQRRGYAWRTFCDAFRSNFKQATILWLALFGLVVLIAVDCLILNASQEIVPMQSLWIGVLLVILVYAVLMGLYLFAYIARFEIGVKGAVINAGRMMLGNALWTVLLLIVFAMAIIAVLVAPILLFFIPSIYMFFANRILEKVFRKYMLPEDLEREMSLQDCTNRTSKN